MSALPNGWCSIPVSEAVSNLPLTGKKIPQKQYLEAGAYPVIDQGQSLVGGYSDDAEALVDCEPPVIVFGDHTKVVKLVKFQFAPGADGIKVLKPHEFIDCLLFKYFLDHVTAGMIDKGYARHYQHLANSQIHLPPLAEQRRIVGKVEELFSELDEGVANLKQARAQLAVYRQALLKHAFEGHLTADWRTKHAPELESADQLLARIRAKHCQRFTKAGKYTAPSEPETEGLPAIPEGWAWARMDLLGVVGSGMSVSKDRNLKSPVEVPYLRVANVQRGHLNLAEMKTMKVEADALNDLKLQPGDILFNEGGDRDKLGRGWVWDGQIDPCITQNHVFRVTPLSSSLMDPKFVSHWGNTFGQQFFLSHGKQTTNLASINKTVLSSLPLPVPSYAEQLQIVSQIEAQTSVISALEADIDLNLQKAEALRQSILKKAFAGELVPQDPADEPTAALLARIRAEREAATARPKAKQAGKRPAKLT